MKDGIIKGEGNSRYLKTVANFLSKYPTYEAFARAFMEGTLPIDLNGINDAGWDQLPTWLNKGTLFSDIAADLYGYEGEDAKPDKAFRGLVHTPGDLCRSFDINKKGPWLLCNGQLYDKKKNKRLFALLSKNTQYESTFSTLPGVQAMQRVGDRFFFMSTDGNTMYYSEENVPFPNFDNAIDLTQTVFRGGVIALKAFDRLVFVDGKYVFALYDDYTGTLQVYKSTDLKSWKAVTISIPRDTSFGKVAALVYYDNKFMFFAQLSTGTILTSPALENGTATVQASSNFMNVLEAAYDELTDKVYFSCKQGTVLLYELSKDFSTKRLFSGSGTQYAERACLLKNSAGVFMAYVRTNYTSNRTVTILKYGTQLLNETLSPHEEENVLGYAANDKVFFATGSKIYEVTSSSATKMSSNMSALVDETVRNFTNESMFVDSSSREVVATIKPGTNTVGVVKTNSPRLIPVIPGENGEYVFIRGDG